MTTLLTRSTLNVQTWPLPVSAISGTQLPADWMPTPAAVATLGRREMEFWQTISQQPHRRRDWLGGRLSAKVAIAQFCWPGDWTKIEILPGHLGQPVVHFNGSPNGALPVVSISHLRAGRIVAVAAATETALGVDIELSGRVSLADLKPLAFTAHDLAVLPAACLDREYLALWVAKEAAAKAARTGFLGRPTAWIVTRYQPVCQSNPEVAQIDICHSGRRFPVLVWREGPEVVALCCPLAASP